MKHQHRRRRNQEAPGSGGNQLLTLSLFIMLLAFFIVLNALSSFKEQKVQPVMQSLEKAFSTDLQDRDVAPSVAPDPLRSHAEGDVVDRLDQLFRAQIASYKVKKSPRLGLMHVEMPVIEFAALIGAAASSAGLQNQRAQVPQSAGGRSSFLHTLLSVLNSDQQGRAYRMDMVLHVAGNPAVIQNREPKAIASVISQAGSFSQSLEKAGMPEKLLGIAVAGGDTDTIEITFRRHRPFNPLGQLSGDL